MKLPLQFGVSSDLSINQRRGDPERDSSSRQKSHSRQADLSLLISSRLVHRRFWGQSGRNHVSEMPVLRPGRLDLADLAVIGIDIATRRPGFAFSALIVP